jgi:glyoxylase-like metal-dependent hydrolase (beta-lactamase superfamily II)
MHSSSPPSESTQLPAGVQVFQRGWLSSNNILLSSGDHAALIDSGYCSHSAQTVALVQAALAGQTLDQLLNTHLHSDHCGGNAALKAAYPTLHTLIPPGLASAVREWSSAELTFEATGQSCPPFRYDALLLPGTELNLGGRTWQVHAAPGHDPHSVVLFEPHARLLISADALWENGFGVVFPELEGVDAFDSVGATLDLIASLKPLTIIPGHGSPFFDHERALQTARARLDYFQRNPQRHRNYAAKVLLKFKLLELQRTSVEALTRWAASTPYVAHMGGTFFDDTPLETVVGDWIAQLVSAGAAAIDGDVLYNQD